MQAAQRSAYFTGDVLVLFAVSIFVDQHDLTLAVFGFVFFALIMSPFFVGYMFLLLGTYHYLEPEDDHEDVFRIYPHYMLLTSIVLLTCVITYLILTSMFWSALASAISLVSVCLYYDMVIEKLESQIDPGDAERKPDRSA
jgi:hypothetical protein